MVRTFLGTSIAACALIAAPAIAQTTGATTDAADTAAPAAATPAPAPGAQPAPASPAANPSQAAAVQQLVDTDFPKYDADKSGALSEAELVKWLTDLKKAEIAATGQAMTDAEIDVWAKGAFAAADADKNGSVTKEELKAFLGG